MNNLKILLNCARLGTTKQLQTMRLLVSLAVFWGFGGQWKTLNNITLCHLDQFSYSFCAGVDPRYQNSVSATLKASHC